MIKLLKDLPCKSASHWNEYLGERWMGTCPMFECLYDGEIFIPDEMECEENWRCPAYEPIETKVCPKHQEEYYAGEWCGSCEQEECNR
jgi:hypothetical protein